MRAAAMPAETLDDSAFQACPHTTAAQYTGRGMFDFQNDRRNVKTAPKKPLANTFPKKLMPKK